MEIQLEQLIEKIKADGVQTAEAQADQILKNARKEAEEIIEGARSKAEKIIDDAKIEKTRMESSGKESLKQAGRDLLINVKKSIEDLFQKVIQEKTAETLKGDNLGDAVLTVVSKWEKGEIQDPEVIIPDNLSDKMVETLRKSLSDQIKNGLTIQPSEDLQAGFRISLKDGSAYFDFSDEELSALISQYLNPRVAALLNS